MFSEASFLSVFIRGIRGSKKAPRSSSREDDVSMVCDGELAKRWVVKNGMERKGDHGEMGCKSLAEGFGWFGHRANFSARATDRFHFPSFAS